MTREKPKLHSLSKSERLCNFTLKKILFEAGESFQLYPLKVYWKVLDLNLENHFFGQSPHQWQGLSGCDTTRRLQNPSYPHRKLPSNAFFPMPAQCLLGVSGRVHKKATQRNYLKRLLREAYRQNKQDFYSFLQSKEVLCIVGFIYTGKTQLSFAELEKKILLSLQRIQEKINADPTQCH